MGELFQESMKLVTRRGWCHCVTMHTATTPQSPLFIRNVSRLHTTIYTTFQTYNYHLQINLTLAPRFLINYLMRRINGHREVSPKLHWDPGARLRLQRPIKSGLNARRDSALHWVNVSLFHRRRFLSGGRCLPWYFESLPSFEAQTADSRDTCSEATEVIRNFWVKSVDRMINTLSPCCQVLSPYVALNSLSVTRLSKQRKISVVVLFQP